MKPSASFWILGKFVVATSLQLLLACIWVHVMDLQAPLRRSASLLIPNMLIMFAVAFLILRSGQHVVGLTVLILMGPLLIGVDPIWEVRKVPMILENYFETLVLFAGTLIWVGPFFCAVLLHYWLKRPRGDSPTKSHCP
jgi:hypothetical protein